jgi:hypothetical protein
MRRRQTNSLTKTSFWPLREAQGRVASQGWLFFFSKKSHKNVIKKTDFGREIRLRSIGIDGSNSRQFCLYLLSCFQRANIPTVRTWYQLAFRIMGVTNRLHGVRRLLRIRSHSRICCLCLQANTGRTCQYSPSNIFNRTHQPMSRIKVFLTEQSCTTI